MTLIDELAREFRGSGSMLLNLAIQSISRHHPTDEYFHDCLEFFSDLEIDKNEWSTETEFNLDRLSAFVASGEFVGIFEEDLETVRELHALVVDSHPSLIRILTYMGVWSSLLKVVNSVPKDVVEAVETISKNVQAEYVERLDQAVSELGSLNKHTENEEIVLAFDVLDANLLSDYSFFPNDLLKRVMVLLTAAKVVYDQSENTFTDSIEELLDAIVLDLNNCQGVSFGNNLNAFDQLVNKNDLLRRFSSTVSQVDASYLITFAWLTRELAGGRWCLDADPESKDSTQKYGPLQRKIKTLLYGRLIDERQARFVSEQDVKWLCNNKNCINERILRIFDPFSQTTQEPYDQYPNIVHDLVVTMYRVEGAQDTGLMLKVGATLSTPLYLCNAIQKCMGNKDGIPLGRFNREYLDLVGDKASLTFEECEKTVRAVDQAWPDHKTVMLGHVINIVADSRKQITENCERELKDYFISRYGERCEQLHSRLLENPFNLYCTSIAEQLQNDYGFPFVGDYYRAMGFLIEPGFSLIPVVTAHKIAPIPQESSTDPEFFNGERMTYTGRFEDDYELFIKIISDWAPIEEVVSSEALRMLKLIEKDNRLPGKNLRQQLEYLSLSLIERYLIGRRVVIAAASATDSRTMLAYKLGFVKKELDRSGREVEVGNSKLFGTYLNVIGLKQGDFQRPFDSFRLKQNEVDWLIEFRLRDS